MPEELWTEVYNILQEADQNHPKEKEMQEGKMKASEEALQIVEKRSDVKGTGERERHTKLNVEFQRRARRDKKGFLNEQCKETEGNNRMGNTRDLLKKIGDIKGTFHARIVTIKDRNGKDLTEVEKIKKRWQEYTEELYRKVLKITTMVSSLT